MLLTFTLAAASSVPAVEAAPVSPELSCVEPVVVSRDDQAEDVGEVVRVQTSDRVSLAGTYFAPRARRGTKVPGAVLIHDAGSNRSGLNAMAIYLTKKGFGVLTLDLRGHGQSATDEYSWETMDEGARRSAWAFAALDLEAASAFLRGRDEIHSANLSLIGIGAGAGLALRHAVDDENTRAVVLLGPPSEESLGIDVINAVIDLAGLPCLIVAPKDGRKEAEKIQTQGHDANDGYEYVTVQVMRSAGDALLQDGRLLPSFSTWLTNEVTPKKNKKGRSRSR